MAVNFNHTIVHSHVPEETAGFLHEVLGLSEPTPFASFLCVETANGVSLDVLGVDRPEEMSSQHYAFLVTDPEFDEIFGRLVERGVDHYADPAASRRGEVNTHFGGRGTYFFEPGGNFLEIITVPYGGWPAGA